MLTDKCQDLIDISAKMIDIKAEVIDKLTKVIDKMPPGEWTAHGLASHIEKSFDAKVRKAGLSDKSKKMIDKHSNMCDKTEI
ncbi:hypothetical protein E2R51_10805 [Jeotgalibacillus sp. S-D1]|uniref:hypothetical protein n=1 Tax=Jeotgalibacillus sp. S-D1 TaxID=2552189 RepID=UPI00105A1F1D|nr:hypothetical protein [Jeotgalibacillus sp. S-D1]TDL31711.1 hypothetical protein E2R51_10805 [Jeotgalibacillus sp. S-D1]